MTEIHFVWAEDLDGWIGKDKQLPWHCSADLRHFRQLTSGHPVVMGKSTYDSIGRPLPNRLNIVLTHSTHPIAGVTTVHSVAELQTLIKKLAQAVYVIGGAGIFRQLLPMATVLNRTVINGHYRGDVKMPPVDYSRWQLVSQQTAATLHGGQPDCQFETWHLDV